MTKKERALFREFYQSLPTSGEKAMFLQMVGADRNAKLAYLATIAFKMTDDQRGAFLAITSMTKEDRMEIGGQVARGFIMSLIYKIMGW